VLVHVGALDAEVLGQGCGVDKRRGHDVRLAVAVGAKDKADEEEEAAARSFQGVTIPLTTLSKERGSVGEGAA